MSEIYCLQVYRAVHQDRAYCIANILKPKYLKQPHEQDQFFHYFLLFIQIRILKVVIR